MQSFERPLTALREWTSDAHVFDMYVMNAALVEPLRQIENKNTHVR